MANVMQLDTLRKVLEISLFFSFLVLIFIFPIIRVRVLFQICGQVQTWLSGLLNVHWETSWVGCPTKVELWALPFMLLRSSLCVVMSCF